MYFTVKYFAGPYSGTRRVSADDEEEAIAKVRRWVRNEMSLPMYSDFYRVIEEGEHEESDDDY